MNTTFNKLVRLVVYMLCALAFISSSVSSTATTLSDSDDVFKSAAHMPSFPGGDAALMRFIYDNLRWPQTYGCIQGKVVVQFVVEKDGSVGEVKVARGFDPDFDKEAVRVVKMLPKFEPGRNAVGEPVKVWYVVPITFKLQPVNEED